MKTLNETFTDQEWQQLKQAKVKSERNWHDFIMCLAYIDLPRRAIGEEVKGK